MARYAVDREFSSGCWDSCGHEVIRFYRYKSGTLEDAVARYNRVLSDPQTRRARISVFNERTGRYEPVAVGDMASILNNPLPAGASGGNLIQTVLM